MKQHRSRHAHAVLYASTLLLALCAYAGDPPCEDCWARPEPGAECDIRLTGPIPNEPCKECVDGSVVIDMNEDCTLAYVDLMVGQCIKDAACGNSPSYYRDVDEKTCESEFALISYYVICSYAGKIKQRNFYYMKRNSCSVCPLPPPAISECTADESTEPIDSHYGPVYDLKCTDMGQV